MSYSFSVFSKNSACGIKLSLNKILKQKSFSPIFLCIGSDLALGDSLGPLVGTLLVEKYKLKSFVYGTLSQPVTAKEIPFTQAFLDKLHPNNQIIAIDAAVGKSEDVGIIKISPSGLYPGLGINKKLNKIGNFSIMGIVAEKTQNSFKLLNFTRLNFIYKMAETIAEGIYQFFTENEYKYVI